MGDPSPGGRRILRPTWVPSRARHYRRPGGPWRSGTLDALISERAGELVDGQRRLSPEATEEIVSRVAGGLARRGVRRGHGVAWRLPNGLNAAVLFRSCWRLGAVAVPVMASLGDKETRAALAQVDPAYVVPLDRDGAADPGALCEILDGPPVPPPVPDTRTASGTRAASIAVVLFTSGSTGAPKAVLHTHRALAYKADVMARVHGLGHSDSVLVPAPMAHVSGLLNGVLVPGAAGMRAVYTARFDPEEALAIVARERVTFMAGPPTFFVAMAAAAEASRSAPGDSPLRLISTGGASVTPAFVEATAATLGCRVKRTYGSTEAPTVTTSTGSDPVECARDTDGRAVGEVELRVVDPATGSVLGTGTSGELWVRGPELFAGYAYREQNSAVLASGGWFRTGDLAIVDGAGWLRIVGRLKDVIIRGGENIAAADVEAVLEAHPDIRQAVAVGYPDDLMGERVCAFVVSDAPFGLEECRRWFADREVSRFKTPERVERVPELPLLASGKADRAAMRARAAGGGS